MKSYDYDIDIISMSKRDLAQLYAPELTPRSAVNRLMRWISIHPVLSDELRKAGYRKTAKVLSPRQVELIVEHLGEP
jgi:hypothetical protein